MFTKPKNSLSTLISKRKADPNDDQTSEKKVGKKVKKNPSTFAFILPIEDAKKMPKQFGKDSSN